MKTYTYLLSDRHGDPVVRNYATRELALQAAAAWEGGREGISHPDEDTEVPSEIIYAGWDETTCLTIYKMEMIK